MHDAALIACLTACCALPVALAADPEARGDRRVPYALPLVALAACLPMTRGLAGVALAALYIALTLVLGARAGSRALSRPVVQASELGLAAAWVWAVGGGVWLMVFASGGTLLGFGDLWALLTAAHFHAAGFAAVSITALLVRATGRGAWLLALHPVAFACVAAGLAGTPVLERVGAGLYLALFGAQWLVAVGARLWRRRGGWLALAALTVPTITLALAADWALGPRRLSLEQTIWAHGLVNAAGHGLLGLLAFGVMAPRPRAAPVTARFSAVRGGLRIGPGLVAELAPAAPMPRVGLVDDLAGYARPGFDPGAVDAEIAAFYARTAEYALEASHRWQPGFGVGGALFGAFARRMGQMGLPGPGTPSGAMSNALVDIDDARDGRSGVRAWVRTWTATGATLYVALYSEHVTGGERFMNIAFPVPGGTMTSILRFEQRGAGAIALTTLRAGVDDGGDHGVYLRLFGWRPWRLPIDETITVERRGDGLVARHDMWIFGRLFLVLDYAMRRRPR